MKNSLKFGLYVATALSILIGGCKKKPKDDLKPIANCETTYQGYYGDAPATNESVTASYQDGQIKSLNYSSAIINYEYAANVVTLSYAGSVLYRIETSDNLARKIIDLKSQLEERMSYDGNRNLIKIETYFNNALTDTKTLTYANGNLITLTQTFTDSPNAKRVTNYTYSSEIASKVDVENRHLLFHIADSYIPSFLIGNNSRNILTGSHYNNTSGDFRSDIATDYTYSKNSAGVINKIIENTHTVTVSNGIKTQDEQLKQTILVNTNCN